MAFIAKLWRNPTLLSTGGVGVSKSCHLVRLRVGVGLRMKNLEARDVYTSGEGGKCDGHASWLQAMHASGASYGQRGVIFGSTGKTSWMSRGV